MSPNRDAAAALPRAGALLQAATLGVTAMALLAAAVLLAAALVAPVAAATPAEDLLEVWAQARAADPLLAQARAQQGLADETAEQARAALLPQWNLSLTQQQSGSPAAEQQVLGSSVSQVLLDLGRLRTLDAARSERSAQQARLLAAEQELAGRVARAYLGVLQAQATLATAQAQEQAFAAQVEQARARYAAGLSALLDLEQARAYHQLSRGAGVAAAQALADAREALAQITGRAPGPLRPLAAGLSPVLAEPADAQAWVDRALAQHPLLQALDLQQQAASRRVDAARAAHAPTLTLSLDHEQRRGVAGVAPGQVQPTWMLRLRVPLSAGGATQSLVRQAEHQRQLQQAELELRRRGVVRELRAQHGAVAASAQLMTSTREAVAAAARALDATRAGQSLGTRTMTDLLLALQVHNQALAAHEQARHGHVLALLLLQAAAGRLGGAELAQANQLLQGG